MRPYAPGDDTAARAMLLCRDTEILMEGPAGTGKTRALLEKAFIAANNYPGCRILLTRKTRKAMTESVLVTWEDKVVPFRHPVLAGASRKLRHSYEFANGSSVVIVGLDDPDKIMSTEYDMILIFEATETTADDYEKLLSRLRNGVIPYQQIIADCNPSYPKHWLNVRASGGGMTRLLSRHEDNPMLFRDGEWTDFGASYVERLERMTGHRLQRLRYGKWAAADGLVYEEFDSAIHLCTPVDITPMRKFVSVDFGYNNPFVCQWWAIDGDGSMYRYRLIYKTKTLVEDHARLIRELSRGERIECAVCDHDAEDRATFARHSGMHTVPAVKSIEDGIQAVKARLRVGGNGKPRMYFVVNALHERDRELEESKSPADDVAEFDCYVMPPGSDNKNVKEVPVDKDNHGMDAMRYAVRYVDGNSGTIMVPKPDFPAYYEDRRVSGGNW